MPLALQIGKAKPRGISDYVMVLGAFAVFTAGSLFTASVILSPEHEVSGVIADMRTTGLKSKKFFVTLATNSGERKEFEVSRLLHGSVAVNDPVRLVYRAWDDEATLVEVTEGPRRGPAWKQGILDVVMGPIAMLFGAGAAWALIRNLRRRKNS